MSKESAFKAFTAAIKSSKVSPDSHDAILNAFGSSASEPHSLDLQQKGRTPLSCHGMLSTTLTSSATFALYSMLAEMKLLGRPDFTSR